MVRSEEEIIDGVRVVSTQLPARRALTLKIKLTKLLAPALGKLMSASDAPGTKTISKIMDSSIDPQVFSAVVDSLTSAIEPDLLFNMIIECLASTRVEKDGRLVDVSTSTFDALFTGELSTLYKIVWFSLRVNFADFFAMGSTLLNKAETVRNLQPSEPSTALKN